MFDLIVKGGTLPDGTISDIAIKGERIADTAVLHIAPDAAPGAYRLLLGFYDAAHGGARLPAVDEDGAPLPDQAVVLTEITVAE